MAISDHSGCDVSVMGAGIVGLTVAWACAARGARVQVIDPGGPGAGASGGILGALAPHVPENWNPKKAFQLQSLLAARDFWPMIEGATGLPTGYRASGRLQPLAGPRDVALAQARITGAQTHWGRAARWEVGPASQAEAFGLPPDAPYVHDTLSALINPRLGVTALAAALAARGVPIHAEGQAQSAVLWATGIAGLAALGEDLGLMAGTGVKGQAALLACDLRSAPQLFTEALHIIPHSDGTVAVGSTSERDFGAPNTTDDALDDLIARARTLVPVLGTAPVVARWAGVRPRARTRSPLLGAWPGRAGHFVANGGFKIGFGMALAMAEATADLILEDRASYPPEFDVAASLGVTPPGPS